MPSIISHVIVGPTLGLTFSNKKQTLKFWIASILCSIIPDADVIMFKFGIAYSHVLGHRGFSHSILFSVLLGLIITVLFFREIKISSIKFWSLTGFLSIISILHSLLDAMTNGGLGVALLAPFNNSRFFMPFRPIQVSPIGIDHFFSEWGLRVIISELFWIWLPCLILIIISLLFKRLNNTKNIYFATYKNSIINKKDIL